MAQPLVAARGQAFLLAENEYLALVANPIRDVARITVETRNRLMRGNLDALGGRKSFEH